MTVSSRMYKNLDRLNFLEAKRENAKNDIENKRHEYENAHLELEVHVEKERGARK